MMNLTFFLIFPVQTIEHNVPSSEEIPENDSEDLRNKPSTVGSMRKGSEVKRNSRVCVASDVSDVSVAKSLIQKKFTYISNDGTKVNSSKGSFSHPVSLAGKGVPNSNFEKSKSHNSKKMLTSTAASAVAKSEKKNESSTNAAHQIGPKRIAAVQANENPKR